MVVVTEAFGVMPPAATWRFADARLADYARMELLADGRMSRAIRLHVVHAAEPLALEVVSGTSLGTASQTNHTSRSNWSSSMPPRWHREVVQIAAINIPIDISDERRLNFYVASDVKDQPVPASTVMVRAAAYCRISSDPNERGVGVKRQEDDCRRLADMREWNVVDVYIDNDRSAWNGKARPEFQRLLGDISAGGVDAVIVYQSSRLTRRPTELEAFIDLHKQTGVRLVTTNGDVDLGSAAGRFMARIHGAQAANESDQISERVRRAMTDNAKRGQPHGGKRPYGFDKNRIDHDPHEASVLRSVVDSILGGESLRSVCTRINANGERTTNGKIWSTSVLRHVILQPRMIGLRSHRRSGVHPAAWKPILTPDEQVQLRAVLRSRSFGCGPGRPASHLLSGILRCDLCGSGMYYLPGFDRRPSSYRCKPKADGGCGGRSIDAIHAEAFVEATALQVADRDAVTDVVPAQDTSGIKARLVQLSEAFAREDISWDEYMAAKKVIESRISQAVIANAQRLSADRVRDRWQQMSVTERREAILSLLGHIVVTKGGGPRFDPDRLQVDTLIRPGVWAFATRETTK